MTSPSGMQARGDVQAKDERFIAACLERARGGPGAVSDACRGLSEEDYRRKPGAGKLSLFEHVATLLDMERDVFGVRIRRVLEEDDPRLDPVDPSLVSDAERHAGRTFQQLFDEWRGLRQANVELVESTGPAQWSRPVRHPELGNATFADVVDRWSRHDADHLRQIAIVARNCRERKLR